ncbi:hypothetical protein BDY19DRAFT_903935 [Irpex rosettiformis]|uniref:Uncharacterized protein n=1 Tax=Irpex rosettiformis TaxID=378272 RepID=A0ACB8UD79_9APHY|nr:hypothetical protein BDY19DRAFT_903935 [Irpex rosettiformis]
MHDQQRFLSVQWISVIDEPEEWIYKPRASELKKSISGWTRERWMQSTGFAIFRRWMINTPEMLFNPMNNIIWHVDSHLFIVNLGRRVRTKHSGPQKYIELRLHVLSANLKALCLSICEVKHSDPQRKSWYGSTAKKNLSEAHSGYEDRYQLTRALLCMLGSKGSSGTRGGGLKAELASVKLPSEEISLRATLGT